MPHLATRLDDTELGFEGPPPRDRLPEELPRPPLVGRGKAAPPRREVERSPGREAVEPVHLVIPPRGIRLDVVSPKAQARRVGGECKSLVGLDQLVFDLLAIGDVARNLDEALRLAFGVV